MLRKVSLLIIPIALLLVAPLFFFRVSAYTINPSTANINVGDSVTLTVLAAPGNPATDNTSEVILNLEGSGLQITNATVQTGNGIVSFGSCAGGSSYTSTSVCFSFGKTSGGISTGEVMGTIEVTAVSDGQINLVADGSQPAYEPSGTTVNGVVAIVTTSDQLVTLPVTSFETSDYIGILLGMVLVGIGAIGFMILRKIAHAKPILSGKKLW